MKIGFIGFGEVAYNISKTILESTNKYNNIDESIKIFTCINDRSKRTNNLFNDLATKYNNISTNNNKKNTNTNTDRDGENTPIYNFNSYSELFENSNIIISAVTPKSAIEVAKIANNYINNLNNNPPNNNNKLNTLNIPNMPKIYIDLNNISPKTTSKIANYIENNSNGNSCFSFIDGSIIGKVRAPKNNKNNPNNNINNNSDNTCNNNNDSNNDNSNNNTNTHNRINIIASGKSANELNILNNYGINFKVISENIGDASTLKMLRSSYTKSLAALLLESFENAAKLGLEEELFDLISISEGKSFKKSGKSRIKNSKLHSKRKIEEIEEIIDFLSEIDPNNPNSKIITVSKEVLKSFSNESINIKK
ncbi:MAG: hypothetical protein ACRC1M_02210 [Methanobacteriaceae archaeon]